jgi:hypothetical protein
MTILAFPTAIMFDYHPIPAGLSADQFPRLQSLFEILLGAIPRHHNDPGPGRNNVGAAIERPKVTNGKILTLVPVICTETASVIGCFLVALLCIGKIDDPAIVIQHAFQRFGKTAIRRHLRKCGRGNCNECGGYKKPKNFFSRAVQIPEGGYSAGAGAEVSERAGAISAANHSSMTWRACTTPESAVLFSIFRSGRFSMLRC